MMALKYLLGSPHDFSLYNLMCLSEYISGLFLFLAPSLLLLIFPLLPLDLIIFIFKIVRLRDLHLKLIQERYIVSWWNYQTAAIRVTIFYWRRASLLLMFCCFLCLQVVLYNVIQGNWVKIRKLFHEFHTLLILLY